MIALVLIVVALWIAVGAVVILVFIGGARNATPRQPFTRDQLEWFKAAAKAAHRGHA